MVDSHRALRAAATRSTLLRIARERFAEHGFDGVSAEALVQEAGLTRGALYHQFGGKEGLFDAVVAEIQAEVAVRILAAADMADSPWAGLVAGCRAFIEVCAEPGTRRILLVDAPAVLGWARWREIDAAHGLGLLKAGLGAAVASGDLAARPVDPLAHLLSGAMNEAVLWIAGEADPLAATVAATAALEDLLVGLRRSGRD